MLFPAMPLSTMLQMFSLSNPFNAVMAVFSGVLIVGLIGFVVGISTGARLDSRELNVPASAEVRQYSA